MACANYVAEKNEGILFPTEIRVVGSYTDRLLIMQKIQGVKMIYFYPWYVLNKRL